MQELLPLFLHILKITMTGIKTFDAMKKNLFVAAAFAMLFVGCAKEIEVNVEPENTEEPTVEVLDVINAVAPAETKTIVDGVNIKWATGDAITIFDAADGAHEFTLKTGAGETTATFEGSLGGGTINDYALYPHDGNNAKADIMASVIYKSTFPYGSAPAPLLGVRTSDNNFTFSHVGGAIRITYSHVPANAATFEFEATTNICGAFEFDDVTSGVDGNLASTATRKVTITDLPGTADASLEFIVPLPAGSYSFTVRLKDSSSNVINASQKSVGKAKTIAVGHMLNLGNIILPTPSTVTKSISDLFTSSDNSKRVTPFYLDDGDIVEIDQVGDGNNGKYYDSDKSLRYYNEGSLKISVASGYTIQSVNVTYSGSSFTGLSSGTETPVSASSVTYDATATLKITSISVTYISTSHTTASTKVTAPVVSETDNVVTITCATDGATIYYTTNGDAPTTSSTVYSGPFAINEDLTVKAIAAKGGMQNSNVGTCDCTYTALSACAAPTITCSSNTVTITTATDGASIYYTTDGITTPTTSSTLYTAPFAIAANTTVKAIAVKLGRPNSSVTSTDCVFVSSVVVWDDDFSNNASAGSTALGTFAGSKAGYTSNYSSEYCYPEVSAIKLGASKNGGSITTPAFSKLTSTANVTVTLEINGYGSDGGSLSLAVSGGGTLSASSVSATHNGETAAASVSTWDTVSVDITGATSSTTLTISCASKKRHFINSIHIETK